jgi:hypothetical protein
MEIISRIKLKKRGPENDDLPGRIAWLAKFCRLERIEVEILSVLARPHAPEPDGWPVSRVASAIGVCDHTVRELVGVTAPLAEWGLVRVSGEDSDAHVMLNERIERFLFAPPSAR